MVAFALETEDQRLRAMQKLERKNCDLIVVNGPEAIQRPTPRWKSSARRAGAGQLCRQQKRRGPGRLRRDPRHVPDFPNGQ